MGAKEKVEKLRNHVQIHQLKEEGFSVAAIARKVNVSRNTVYSYLNMEFEEATEWVDDLKTRKRKLDPYRLQILNWLKEHPDLSASQISDWLEERCSFKDVGESTVRTYVRELRELYHIPKSFTFRSYEAVPELPKGKQLQVDFGELRVKTHQDQTIKVYVIAFVLSHSRYKYAEWQDRPFTTNDVLRAHENAFEYYGGRTEEIVYDQDALMTVSENGGDIIYTEAFQSYKQQRGFQVYLCRKADPESKGKIENVIKFIKGNFAKHRVFHQLESWNEQCLTWLQRKGNYQVHNTTKKRPVEVFALEKPHLKQISTPLSFESNHGSSIARIVHKDNIIKYQSNRYSVPVGTYNPKEENTVYLKVRDKQLFISKERDSEPIAVHPLCEGKGQLVKSTNHTRNYSVGIQEQLEDIKERFSAAEQAELYLTEIQKKYPRYMRDQIKIMYRVIKHYKPFMDQALDTCVNKQLWSANDLWDVAKHLAQTTHHDDEPIETPLRNLPPQWKEKATVRDLDSYLDILGGV